MMWSGRLRLVGLLLAIVAAQSVIVLIYLKVEESRRTAKQATFLYERLSDRPGPDLQLEKPDGSNRRLSEHRGHVVLLHFWATWCPPCREELPGLLELGRELSKEGQFTLLAVSLDNDWSAVRDFFGEKIPPEIMRDATGSAAAKYEISTLPDTYLMAADGALRLRFHGPREWRLMRAREVLRPEVFRLRGAEHG